MSTPILCFLLICGSFILSSSEIALFSLSRLQLKKIKDHSNELFRKIRILIQDSFGLLITILLFNEIFNISLASLLTREYIEPLEKDEFLKPILGVILTTPVILFVCELTPKVIASKANRLIISLFISPVYALYLLTKPFAKILKFFFPNQQVKEIHHLHEEDFIILAEEQTETGHLHETELELIKNVFEMDDISVEQLATPLKMIITIPATHTLEQAAQILLKEKKLFSRVPISGKSKEDIVGVLNTKDLIEIRVNPEMKNESVMSLAKEPLFTAVNTNLETLFRKMKSKKIQAAFIKNTQGKVTGMITLQDILDTIIEEAFDE